MPPVEPQTRPRRRLAAGFQVQAGFEHEFYLLKQGEEGLEPLDRSLCFGTTGMNSAAPDRS